VAFAVVSVAAALWVDRLAGRPRTTASAWLVVTGQGIGLTGPGILLGVLITLLYWIVAAVRLSRVHGTPGSGHLGYWAIGLLAAAFVVSHLVPGGLFAGAAVRVAGSAVLVTGVLHTRAWFRRRVAPERPYDLVTGGTTAAPLAARPSAEDWNASRWDPEVMRDIERRRHRPTA
jgi:hypothetical protein